MANGGSVATTYFHCAPLTLSPGSVIEPGNWGRLLDLYETVNQQVQLNVLGRRFLKWPGKLCSHSTEPIAMRLCRANTRRRNNVQEPTPTHRRHP